jgi:hypothetical protein
MRNPAWCLISLVVLLGASEALVAQSPAPPTRDSRAVGALQKALQAMGGNTPVDSLAVGNIVIVEGTTTSAGRVALITRGRDQCAEHVQLPKENRAVIYSRGQADETARGATKPASLELAASSPCGDFPLPLLEAAFSDSDVSIAYLGDESVDGAVTQHIQFWSTYASKPALQKISDYSKRDLWIDAATGLPHKVAYQRKEAQGAAAAIRLEVLFSDWRTSSGVTYPYQIKKSWNGTPWTTITIQSVAFRVGLSDKDFSLTPRAGVQ